MRAVIIAHSGTAAVDLDRMLREAGHEPVGVICVRGAKLELPELDVVRLASTARIAPLLAAFEPDVAVCFGFPWRVPAQAIAVPRFGIVNAHPSLLPKHRGPTPIEWALEAEESETGMTLHYMDVDLDTGNILAQLPIPLDGARSWDDVVPRLTAAIDYLLPIALERVERGDPGDPQPPGGSYESHFRRIYAAPLHQRR